MADGSNGNTWTAPFIKDLYNAGWLAKNNSQEVVPSARYDQNIEVRSLFDIDNINYAYSGDPSGGIVDGNYQIHSSHGDNNSCIPSKATPSTKNNYCGTYNRIKNVVDPEHTHKIVKNSTINF